MSTSNEMSEYLHDKIRKHATKQARQNHLVFPHSSVNFLSCGLCILSLAFKKVMLNFKEQMQIVSQLHLQ